MNKSHNAKLSMRDRDVRLANGEICVHCNKCGRWGEREEADDTEG